MSCNLIEVTLAAMPNQPVDVGMLGLSFRKRYINRKYIQAVHRWSFGEGQTATKIDCENKTYYVEEPVEDVLRQVSHMERQSRQVTTCDGY